MGLLLLRDGMLNSVIAARDKWLAPGGSLFPSHCELFLAPSVYRPVHSPAAIKVTHEQVLSEWQDLVVGIKATYNVDYSCLTSALTREKDTYHLQSAIEDILGGGDPDDGSDLDCNFEECTDSDSDAGSELRGDADGAAGSTALASKWTSLKSNCLCGQPIVVKAFDCHSVTVEELESFRCQFELQVDHHNSLRAHENAPDERALEGTSPAMQAKKDFSNLQPSELHPCNSLTCWFDVWFRGSAASPTNAPRVLSTGPAVPATHWGQQTFVFPSLYADTLVEARTLQGTFHVFRLPKTHRMYNVRLQFSSAREDNRAVPQTQTIEYQIE